MFRMSKDFNARVYDEIRKHAILEDSGSHLVALALLKSTIEKLTSTSTNQNNQNQNQNNNNNFQQAVSRGMRILESATNDQKEFASLALLSVIHQYKERHNETYLLSSSNNNNQQQKMAKRRQRESNNNINENNNNDENDSSSLQALLNAEATGGNCLFSSSFLESSEEAALSQEVQAEFLKVLNFVLKDCCCSDEEENTRKMFFTTEEENNADEGLESLVDAL